MARIIKSGEAKDLGLRGRVSKEIVSGSSGSDAVTLRLVEIPVETVNAPARAPHFHPDCEECIYVISGQGVFCTADGEHPLEAGDAILVPSKESHYTRNTGDIALMLLCFFPVADLESHG